MRFASALGLFSVLTFSAASPAAGPHELARDSKNFTAAQFVNKSIIKQTNGDYWEVSRYSDRSIEIVQVDGPGARILLQGRLNTDSLRMLINTVKAQKTKRQIVGGAGAMCAAVLGGYAGMFAYLTVHDILQLPGSLATIAEAMVMGGGGGMLTGATGGILGARAWAGVSKKDLRILELIEEASQSIDGEFTAPYRLDQMHSRLLTLFDQSTAKR